MAQASRQAMAEVWNVTHTKRPWWAARLVRRGLLGLLGLSVVVSTGLAWVSAFGEGPGPLRLLGGLASAAANVALS